MFGWNTRFLPIGSYTWVVWVRDASSLGTQHNSLGSFDTAIMNAPMYSLGPATPCTGLIASASPGPPQPVGTQVTITATASGCPNPWYLFMLQAPGSSTWQLGQGYSPSASFAWNTAGSAAGMWHYVVWVRDASSSGTPDTWGSSWDTRAGAYAYQLQ